jgi:hypothetical protein
VAGIVVAAGVISTVVAGSAAAQTPPRPTNDYSIDLFRGPVLAPNRIVGIAGAYAGVGEGIPGLQVNAAAPAVRPIYAIDDFDWDLAASLSVPLPIAENNDFDNSGERDTQDALFIYATGGALVQKGPFGAGGMVELERYAISSGGETAHALIARYHGLVGFALDGGQVVVGAGVRGLTVGIDAPEANLTLAGVGPQLGLLVRPEEIPFRAGATLRAPVDAGALGEGVVEGSDGIRRLGGLVLPDAVVLPWELEIGAALQLGPRPLQKRFVDPGSEITRVRAEAFGAGGDEYEMDQAEAELRHDRIVAARNLPREHLLITGALLMTGPVDRGVGIESFLASRTPGTEIVPGSSGSKNNFSARVGVQTEPLPNWLQTRFGTYYEPNRFEGTGRQHFTFGADLRFVSTTLWGLVPDGVTYSILTAVDLAPRYESASLGIGVWR